MQGNSRDKVLCQIMTKLLDSEHYICLGVTEVQTIFLGGGEERLRRVQ